MMSVTSMEEIKAKLGAKEVELPCDDGTTITVRLKRPSLMTMALKGHIPNGLMSTVLGIFGQDNKEESNGLEINDMAALLETVCEESFVEPTYEEIKEYLTDEHKMMVFGFSQEGVMALDPIRQKQKSAEHLEYVKNLQKKAE